MEKKIYTKIIGTGCCVPTKKVVNDDFLNNVFYDPATGKPLEKDNREIIDKFYAITNIKERRWAENDQVTSDLAVIAVEEALADAKMDKEDLGFVIFCHNFGDVVYGNTRMNVIPSMSSMLKFKMKIKNPFSVAHDVICGCPGWTQGMIVADAYIRSGMYKRGVVIGADITSRVSDPHDRDSMIYADGAGATIVEAVESEEPVGIISHSSRSDGYPYADCLNFGKSFNPDYDQKELLLKMKGHKLYVYALRNVPTTVKDSIEKAGLQIEDIQKIFIHQANEKMDKAILTRLFGLYGKKEIPEGIMPMVISKLGNSSAATIPMLMDLLLKGKVGDHSVQKGSYSVFCSVGAGMGINSIIYKW
ncbi:MAG: ketoacyl-ACP synthase III [Prolixibacteraceae bacterium]|nr:ketoacyl-ACP synthase III [Prolixibacteraceae bacterium]